MKIKVTADWLDLEVKEYEDGSFEAYESLTDTSHDTTNLSSLRQWLRNLIDETIQVIEQQREKEEK